MSVEPTEGELLEAADRIFTQNGGFCSCTVWCGVLR